tara:strand:- start:509 stop:682 length:174 start_codon:yes stop_codon:yes gene_type:complete
MNKSNLKIGLACGAEILVCGTELDYIELTSWVVFLKNLDDIEYAYVVPATSENVSRK